MNLTTHNLLGYSKPIFESFPSKLKFIEIVRHPLYQLIQMSLNYETIEKTEASRFFYVHLKQQDAACPFWAVDWPQKFSSLNYVEKAIHEMYYMTKKTEAFKKENSSLNILTIPFEMFVLNPYEYIDLIRNHLQTDFIIPVSKVLTKQNVPRNKIADGIPLEIYKRCGWEAPQEGLSEQEELEKRRDYAVNQDASEKSLQLLDELSLKYLEDYPFLDQD